MTLQVNQIEKKYGDNPVLKGVSLDIQPGEFVALLGPSGSGKTTLLNVISGLVRPDSGSLVFDGQDITHLDPGLRKFGMVFQSYALFRHMTVAQNIAFGLKVLPRKQRPNKAAIAKRVSELLELIQLPDLGQRYPAQLSGGQRQRVAMARALAINPHMLLLDEPFSALDAQVRVSLRDSVRELQKAVGVSAIVVTHDHNEALALADRIAVMDNGEITRFERTEVLAATLSPEPVLDLTG